RDADAIEASLALLPESERAGATPPKASGSSAADTVGKVETYLNLGTTIVGGGAGGIAGLVGSKQDKKLREEQGVVKEKELGTGLPGFIDQGLGDAMRAGERAHKQRKNNQREWKEQELPESDATKAKQGIGQVTG